VRQLGGELGLAEEHLREVRRIREVGQNALDRDATVESLEPALLGKEDLGHASAGDAPDQDVLAEPNACVGWQRRQS